MTKHIVEPYGEAKVDITLPDNDDLRINTRVHGDVKSIVFETTDHEGAQKGDDYEVTWPEIYAAVQEWCQK